MQIPPAAMGLVIGKGGGTIQGLRQSPGISSINYTTNGRFQINADSQQALDTVVTDIGELVFFHLQRISGFYPQVAILCFCKSIHHPLLSINNISFKGFSDQIHSFAGSQPERGEFYFSSGEIDQETKNEIAASSDSLTSEVSFSSHWDSSAYKAKLRSCLEPLVFSRHETLRSIKLGLLYGKLRFCSSELQEGVPVAVERLDDLYSRKLLKHFFSSSFSDSIFQDAYYLQNLETLGYRKVSTRKKISMYVTDLENCWRVYQVFVRCEGLEQRVRVTKVRTERRREALIAFCRRGPAATDFRVEIASFGPEVEPIPEMVEWIENAWRNRTPEGLLVFCPCSRRFMAIVIRYEEVDTYLSEHWKLRVAKGGVGEGTGREPLSSIWECVSSSRWFKENGQSIEGEEGVDYALANMEALVEEGAKLSCLMNVE